MSVRLQKFLSDAGVASRRAAEKLILEGRVYVNGAVAKELGTKVDPSSDRVQFDGRLVQVKKKLYIALHKPKGCICSRNDPEGRSSIHDLLPKEWSNLYSVGRLDYNSEGLIFLTNDGDFCLHLTHPRYGVRKIYNVTLDNQIDQTVIAAIEKGVFHEGEILRAERARIVATAPGYSQVQVELREGKNREVRRMFEAQKLTVKKLLRVQIGTIKLGELPAGKWRTLSAAEIKSLMTRNLEPRQSKGSSSDEAPTPRRKRPESAIQRPKNRR